MTSAQMLLAYSIKNSLFFRKIIDRDYFFAGNDLKMFAVLKSIYQSGRPIDGNNIYNELSNLDINSHPIQHYNEIADESLHIASDQEFDRYFDECCEIEKKKQFEKIETSKLKIGEIRLKIGQIESQFGSSIKQPIYTSKEMLIDSLSSDVISYPSGFDWIDEKQGGIEKELIIIAARPSQGKTTLALNFMLKLMKLTQNNDLSDPLSILFFSAEMAKRMIGNNLLSILSGVESTRIRKRLYSNKEQSIISEKAKLLADRKFLIDDTPNIEIEHLKDKAFEAKDRFDIDIIFIDYIQLLQTELKSSQPRHEQVAYISGELKKLQRQLDIPVVPLAQLNRGTNEDRPSLKDLKDSGAIEQDADRVYFIHDISTENYPGVSEIIAAKYRNGQTGSFKCYFKRDCLRFIEIKNKLQEYKNDERDD